MKFIVTGGCGFIGSHLVKALIEEGQEVIVVDDLSLGRKEKLHPKAVFHQEDISAPGIFETLLDKVDGCFHLAAVSSVELSRPHWFRSHQVNSGGLVALYDAIVKTDRKIPVVYASSAAIYGNGAGQMLNEDDMPVPLTAYGADKLACEHHSRVASTIHRIPTAGLRFFNVYGQGQEPSSPYSGVISIFSHRLSRGEKITLYGDGKQSRDFIHVSDVVIYLLLSMNALLSSRMHCDILNVCTGSGTSLNQLIRILGELCGREPCITYQESRRGDIRVSLGNPARIQKAFQVSPQMTLAEGLKDLIDGEPVPKPR